MLNYYLIIESLFASDVLRNWSFNDLVDVIIRLRQSTTQLKFTTINRVTIELQPDENAIPADNGHNLDREFYHKHFQMRIIHSLPLCHVERRFATELPNYKTVMSRKTPLRLNFRRVSLCLNSHQSPLTLIMKEPCKQMIIFVSIREFTQKICGKFWSWLSCLSHVE